MVAACAMEAPLLLALGLAWHSSQGQVPFAAADACLCLRGVMPCFLGSQLQLWVAPQQALYI